MGGGGQGTQLKPFSVHPFEGVKEETHPPRSLCPAVWGFDPVWCSSSIWNPVVGKERRGLTAQSPLDSRCRSRDPLLSRAGIPACQTLFCPGPCMHCLLPHHLELLVPPPSNDRRCPLTTRQRSGKLLIERDGPSEGANPQHLSDGPPLSQKSEAGVRPSNHRGNPAENSATRLFGSLGPALRLVPCPMWVA